MEIRPDTQPTPALVTPAPLPDVRSGDYSAAFAELWPRTVAWVEPYYDGVHLFHTARWLRTLDPDVSEPLLIAGVTHDMERHFPGGTQPDKAAGAWDDVAYNTRHCRRSATIVADWLRDQGVSAEFIARVEPAILEHEFGGSADGDLLQAADSIWFLEVNGRLVTDWVLRGETTLPLGLEKLEWMYERIKPPHAREIARPYLGLAVESVRTALAGEVAEGAASSPPPPSRSTRPSR